MSRVAAVVTVVSDRPQDTPELFVGREAQVDELLRLLAPVSHDRGAVVTGMGGVGKTALVRHASSIAAGRGWFPGGVLFVDLRGYDLDDDHVRPEQVFAPMLRVLDVPDDEIPATADEQAAVYHRVLDRLAGRDEPVLVVLDDAATGRQVADLIPRRAAHRALITTRDAVAVPVAGRLDLDVMPEHEAVQLLGAILTRRLADDGRATRDPRAAADLVSVCGALPLAVEITASILADEPDLAIGGLVTELSAAEGPGAHRVRYGENTLTTVFHSSWRRLRIREPEAAELLPLLSLNPGSDFSSDTAAALAGQPPARVSPWLRALRQASLLQCRNGRWSLHDLIRLNARDQCAAREREPALDRLFAAFRRNVTAANDHLRVLPGEPLLSRFGSRTEALAWLDAEHANLVAVVVLALETGRHVVTIGLANQQARYFAWRRHFADWVTVSQLALAAARHLDSPAGLAACLNHFGLALQSVRRFEEAVAALKQAAAMNREMGDLHGEGAALNNLAGALKEIGRLDEAVAVYQRAIAVLRDDGDHRLVSQGLNNLGAVMTAVGRLDEAVKVHREAALVFRLLGDRHSEAMALNGLGLALERSSRFEEAAAAYRLAGTLHRMTGDRYGEGQVLNNLGATLLEVSRYDEAVVELQAAAAVFREFGDDRSEGQTLTNLGLALCGAGMSEAAVAAFEAADVCHRKAGDIAGYGRASGKCGLALQAAGKVEEAVTAHGKAVAAYREIGDLRREGQALNGLALALLELERFGDAAASAGAAAAIFRRLGDRRDEAIALFSLGQAWHAVGRSADAEKVGKRAVAAFREFDDTFWLEDAETWIRGLA
ncbi:tetratricopeptide repeat protein [Amycolatopsis sp. NPDC003865]